MGRIEFDLDDDQCPKKATFVPELRAHGRFEMWINTEDIEGRYVLGIDVAAGTGASYSVISIAELAGGQKVAQWTDNTLRPDQVAHHAVALAKMFNHGRIIFEANGPTGRVFGKTVVKECRYLNLYWRKDDEATRSRSSDKPGFWSSPASKTTLLETYRTALHRGTFRNPSTDAVAQCRFFIYTSDQKVVHSASHYDPDFDKRGTNHGDHVIADALANKLVWEQPKVRHKPEAPKEAVAGTFAHRMAKWKGDSSKEYGRW